MSAAKSIEEQLKEREKHVEAKAKAKRDAKSAGYAQRRLAFLDAKEKALDSLEPEQLLDVDVENVGWALLRWPDDITYGHFMRHTGALKGDLAKMTMEHVEDLIARCTLFPEKAAFLTELRERNPGARTVIVDRLLGAMRKRLADEGK